MCYEMFYIVRGYIRGPDRMVVLLFSHSSIWKECLKLLKRIFITYIFQ